MKPLEKTLYTNATGAPADLSVDVAAKDEWGTSLPITGGLLTFASAHDKHNFNKTLTSTSGDTGVTVTGLITDGWNNGTATVSVSGIEGPTSSSHKPKGSANVTLETSKLTSASITAKYATIYPNIAGYHSTETLTADVKNNSTSTLTLVSPSVLDIVKGSTVVYTDILDSTGTEIGTWDGRTSGVVVPGKYSAVASAQLADGIPVTSKTYFEVSAAEPVNGTVSVTYPASKLLKFGTPSYADCKKDGSGISCSEGASGVASALGEFAVPSKVLLLASGYHFAASVSVTVKHLSGSGSTDLALDTGTSGSPETTINSDGVTTTSAYTTFDSSNVTLKAGLYLSGASSLEVTKVTINDTYAAIG